MCFLFLSQNWFLRSIYRHFLLQELVGTTFKDLCHPHDLSTLTKHLSDTIHIGESKSEAYRLRISPDKFLKVQTKSKFFKANVMNTHECDFMMATNSIIG